MNVRILDEAEDDRFDGFQFYEKQSPGLGEYFLNPLFLDIDSLHLYAGIHAVYHGYHRLLAKRFPYAIYNRSDGKSADVHAVVDCRRDPVTIQGQLK